MSAKNANKPVKTAGEFRTFLAGMMAGVMDGTVDIEKASVVTKIAGQINESFYAEVKVARIRAESGKSIQKIGKMKIGR